MSGPPHSVPSLPPEGAQAPYGRPGGRLKLVWDFGGVLFHWLPARLVQREIPQHATDEASAAHWVREIFQNYGGDWSEFDRGTVSEPELVRRIAARTGLAEREVQAVVDGVPGELQPIRETVALLGRLHDAGHTQFYLSNMPAPYADHLEAEHDFVRRFDGGVFSARVQHIKPEPAIFALAARQFGVPPAELLFFDDHRPNVEAARQAGWTAFQFTTAANAENALIEHGLLAAR